MDEIKIEMRLANCPVKVTFNLQDLPIASFMSVVNIPKTGATSKWRKDECIA